MSLGTLVTILMAILVAFAAGFAVARRVQIAARQSADDEVVDAPDAPERVVEPVVEPVVETVVDAPERVVPFDVVAARGTSSTVLEEHADEWRAAMREVGTKLRGADVAAAVFAHGSFVGTDPFSALPIVQT